MSAKDGIVHLWDLPEERVNIGIDELMQDVLEKAVSVKGSISNLAKFLGIHRRTISSYKDRKVKSIPLIIVKKLLEIKEASGEISIEDLKKDLL